MENSTEIGTRTLEQLIIDLCDIILTKNQDLSRNDAECYIASLSKEELDILMKNGFDNRQKVREVVLISVLMYLYDYRNKGDVNKTSPFDFAEGGFAYTEYCIFFRETFKTIHGCKLPEQIIYVLSHIQEITDYFRIFDVFFEIKNSQTAEALLKNVEKTVEEKTTEKAEKIATEKTQEITDKVVQKKVNEAIKGKMHTVTEKISETSVTILGIFSGIVLTVVAGLFYSSSVLESASSTSLHKLFIIATVVGFVCINIIAIMFDYITKIRNGNKVNQEDDSSKIEPISTFKDRITTYYYKLTDANNFQVIEKQKKKKRPIRWLLERAKNHLFIIIIDTILIAMMMIATFTYKSTTDVVANTDTQQENHISVDLNVAGMKDDNNEIIDPSPTTAPSEAPAPAEKEESVITEEETPVISKDKKEEK